MTRDQITTKVIDIIAEMVGVDHPPAGERFGESTAMDELGFDSMDVCEIELSIKDVFDGLDVNGSHWITVGDIVLTIDMAMNCYSDA